MVLCVEELGSIFLGVAPTQPLVEKKTIEVELTSQQLKTKGKVLVFYNVRTMAVLSREG